MLNHGVILSYNQEGDMNMFTSNKTEFESDYIYIYIYIYICINLLIFKPDVLVWDFEAQNLDVLVSDLATNPLQTAFGGSRY
jgi:hypothetical protein